MAYVVMAYIVMAYIGLAYTMLAYLVIAYVVTALGTVVPPNGVPYIHSYGPRAYQPLDSPIMAYQRLAATAYIL